MSVDLPTRSKLRFVAMLACSILALSMSATYGAVPSALPAATGHPDLAGEGVAAANPPDVHGDPAEWTFFGQGGVPLPRPVATPVTVESWSIGSSALGYPIEVYRFGQGVTRIAVIGGLHGGYEANTFYLVLRMVHRLQENPAAVPAAITLYLIPCANPDGCNARNKGEEARFNGHGVDLNRNWDYRWQPVSEWKEGQPLYGGLFPFSEPETSALRTFLRDEGIAAAVFYHSQGGFIAYRSDDVSSWNLARCLAYTTRYDLEGASSGLDYTVTGDAVDYLAYHGVAAVDIELTTHVDPEWKRNARALLAGLQCWSKKR